MRVVRRDKHNTMIPLEEYLLSIGYERFRYDYKKSMYEKEDKHSLSTLGDIHYTYFPENVNPNGEKPKGIRIGLNEVGKPPTLIHPRPRYHVKRNGEDFVDSDDNINVILEQYSPKEVYNAILDRSIILKADLTK
jgi:hypothetical protein